MELTGEAKDIVADFKELGAMKKQERKQITIKKVQIKEPLGDQAPMELRKELEDLKKHAEGATFTTTTATSLAAQQFLTGAAQVELTDQ